MTAASSRSDLDLSGVRIRPVTEADLPIIFEHQSDPLSAAMAAIPVRDHDAFTAHWTTLLADPAVSAWIVDLDGVAVGDLAIWLDGDRTEIGYRIARPWWRRGLATAAVRLLLVEVTVRPLHARVAEDNIGSRRVLEHCGFSKTGEHTADDGVREWHYRLGG